MKKRLKIPGIVLILAMLSGLLMAAAPVSASAANLSWSDYPLPKMTVGTSANVYAFSGDGNTMYLFTAGTVNPGSNHTGKLYKSTDGGVTWTNFSLDTNPTGYQQRKHHPASRSIRPTSMKLSPLTAPMSTVPTMPDRLLVLVIR